MHIKEEYSIYQIHQMEKTNPYLFQSSVRQFSDISNFRLNTTISNNFLHTFKSSYVTQNNHQHKQLKSTSFKQSTFLKPNNLNHTINQKPDLKLTLAVQASKTPFSNLKRSSAATTPRTFFSYSDQLFPSYTESASFRSKKATEGSQNRSLRVSTVVSATEALSFGQNTQKQNKPITMTKRSRNEKSMDKQKISFRDSLGSLSKQIKNTLKLPIKNNDINDLPSQKTLGTLDYKKSQNVTLIRFAGQKNSRTGSILKEKQYLHNRQQKRSSFFLNASTNRLKKPKDLDLKLNMKTNLDKSTVEVTQKNIPAKFGPKIQKYKKKQLQTQRFPLERSTAGSFIFQKENQLKYSSVVEPLTPQLRSTRKYQSYNQEKDTLSKTKHSAFELTAPVKSDAQQSKKAYNHMRDSSILTNLTADTMSKRISSMTTSSVLQRNKFASERNSLSSRERSSFGKDLNLKDFQLGSVKGEGRFGKFYPAIHKKTGILVGIKQIKKESLKNMMDQFIQQLKIQSFIEHPNIVKLYGYFCTKQNFYLVLQYMEEGSLFTFIKKSKKLHQEQASTKLKQICSAVQYLHEKQIIHRDIKPQNVVMTCDVCKLCDFGWAVYSSTRRKTYCGTLDYVCPQILQGDSYDACVDIWAIGVLAYEMIVGKAPFYNISRKETMKKIMDCNFELPKQLSINAKDFISRALNKNPQFRQSLQFLSKHEFLN